MRCLLGLFLWAGVLAAAGTTVRFDISAPDGGPFPSDAFTAADSTQKTGLRINLPVPDCGAQPSSCAEVNLLNQLDGFSLTARVRARFSAPIDTGTLAGGMSLVALDNLTQEEPGIHKTGDTVKINRVEYDPATNTVYAKPDSTLDQHRRYALVITDAVKDKAGDAVGADPAFQVCAQGNGGAYCTELAAAVATASAKAAPAKVVGAAAFTTMSATVWLEKARALLAGVPPAVTMLPQAAFQIANLDSLVFQQQTGANPTQLTTFTIPLPASLLQGLGSIYIGSYTSPNFLNAAQTIDPAATGADLNLPAATNQVYFNALVPDAAKPAAGYPVVIFGHGFGDSRFGGPTAVAPTLAGAGFAVIAINAVGHGFGPESTVTFVDKAGKSTTLPAGGRSIDLNGDGVIGSEEGCNVNTPVAVGTRDCMRQTAVDLLQLVEAIGAGIDLDGDGQPDLDPSHIYYAGQSLGAIYGTIVNAVEPNIRAAALNVGGGSVTDIARWSPSYHDLVTETLRLHNPPLLNQGDSWNEDYVLRDQPVKAIAVPGALDIQNFFETVEWLGNAGDPLCFAPHLKTSPLAGVAARPVLFQFATADRTVLNPQNSALIRAANLRENSWLYRHDRALKVAPLLNADLPLNPHPYLVLFADFEGSSIKLPSSQLVLGVSALAQGQIAAFFTSDGASIPDPNSPLIPSFLLGGPLFEVPAALPETPGF